MQHLSLGAACALLLTGIAGAQNYGMVSSETFEYATGGLGGQGGGTGWFTTWWSGNNADDGIVTTPGHDAVGEKMTTNWENAGSFRMPETGPHPDLAPNFNFGSGDGVMWITFTARRAPGASDDYGGLSLFTQFAGEKLYLGSPYQSYEWGIADPIGGGVATVPGSNVDQLSTLAVRITFATGGDTIDLWVDPADMHPATTPDATLTVADFEWNELRLQSGANNGGSTGYEFDRLIIEKELGTIGTNYCGPAIPNSSGNSGLLEAYGSEFVADNDVTLQASGLAQNQFSMFVNSMSQGLVTPPGSQGNLCLSGGIGRHKANIINTGATGEASLVLDLTLVPTPSGPVAVQPGETWYWQLWFRDNNPTATSNFTDGVGITFQ